MSNRELERSPAVPARHSGAAPKNRRPIAFGTGLIALDVVLSAEKHGHGWLAAGGTCGNVLAALSFFGWQSYPIARLNGDAASVVVQRDLTRWSVGLDFACQKPSSATPIIVQRIDSRPGGTPRHRFLLTCPVCREWLPSFKPLTREAALGILDQVGRRKAAEMPSVFFFDRTSRGTLLLAAEFAERGAVVVFEPCGVGDPTLLEEALSIAHVLKYSRDRMPDLARRRFPAAGRLLEVETRGELGLRFRSSLLSSTAWVNQAAVPAPVLRDAAGAGDWCTAAMLSVLACGGLPGFRSAGKTDVLGALRFGQAAAAIACSFEGARGAMEVFTPEAFRAAADALALGAAEVDAGGRALPSRPDSLYSDGKLLMERVCPRCS